jgi:MFS transporter, NNP family, nitrate/nitrite transporter
MANYLTLKGIQPVISRRLSGIVNDIFPFSLLPLFLLVGIFYVNFVCRVVIAPLLPVIKADLGLGLTRAGSLFLLTATGYCSGLFMSGFVTARLSHRRTILLSMGVMGAAMLALSQTTSSTGMYLSLITAGLSAGFYLPSGIIIVTELVAREHWGRAMAFHELAPNLGFITAPLLAEALLRVLSWRGALAFMGSWSVMMGLVFFFFGQGGGHRGKAPRFSAMRSILTRRSFWTMAVFFTVSIGASFGVYSMLPLFLVSERGMSREWANTLVSLSRTVAFLIIFLSGWITDRAGEKCAMVLFLTTTGLFILLIGMIQVPIMTPLLVVLQASSAACMFPVGFTMLSTLFPNSLRSLAVSLVIMIGYLIGGGAFPLGIGYIAEKLSFSWSFSLIGLLALITIPLLFLIHHDGRVDP